MNMTLSYPSKSLSSKIGLAEHSDRIAKEPELPPELSLAELLLYQRPVPRYTSYPTSPSWHEIDSYQYEKELLARPRSEPTSVYIHVPFCRSICLFCGCHVILSRKEEQRLAYADLVDKEIDEVFSRSGKVAITQLHLGGGTPTYMPFNRLEKWIDRLAVVGEVGLQAEISIEIDPRSLSEGYEPNGIDRGIPSAQGLEKLQTLKQIGFNRVSFGVQDTNPKVQEAILRRQSAKMSEQTIQWARQAGFSAINVDLIYGLPFQTLDSFEDTVRQVAQWRPSRIALFSYANVPWMKPHQKAIKASDLPSNEVKLQLYLMARSLFISEGYVAIGMDHFALAEDEMTLAYQSGRLQRNFQGYSLRLAEDLIGLGVSSTGFVQGLYVQNIKEIEAYSERLSAGRLATYRGLYLSDDDRRRRWVIQKVMCDFRVDYEEYQQLFNRDFACDFALEIGEWFNWQEKGLALIADQSLIATDKGRVFIRLLASTFDAYLRKENPLSRFSMSI